MGGRSFTTPCRRDEIVSDSDTRVEGENCSPEGEGNDEVEGNEHEAFEPVGLAVGDEDVDEEDRDEEDDGLEVLRGGRRVSVLKRTENGRRMELGAPRKKE